MLLRDHYTISTPARSHFVKVSIFFLISIIYLYPDITFAQIDDYNARVIQDNIYSMHLYRDKLLNDKYRPTYHFAIPEGIANPFDPNGAIYWQGRYHLFYIFQPYRPREGHRGDAWAHISSHDLVHWRFHPTALKPGEDDPEVAIYSGNTFLDKQGRPTIIYQGLGAGNCIARAIDDDLNQWQKSDYNPVIPYPEYVQDNDQAVFRSILDKLPEYGRYDVWDPHAWLEGDTYYAISGDNDLWPAKQATLWKSTDLDNWDLVGDFFHHGEPEGVLDCPDFFKLDDKWVLVYLGNGLDYVIGDFKNEQFYPEKYGTMTWESGVGYAPESLVDDKGRRIMWAALYDPRTRWGEADHFLTKHGWDGVLTLPRILSMDNENNLLMQPVEELKALRSNHIFRNNLTIDNSELIIGGVEGNTLELNFSIRQVNAKEYGIKLLCAPDGSEETSIIFDAQKQVIRVDLSKTTLDKSLMQWRYSDFNYRQEAKLNLPDTDLLKFHIFIDRSVLEVFVNERICLTHRIYPTRDDSNGIILISEGGKIEVPKFDAWHIVPSNPW
jgi:beta-fructofuranosidase